MLRLWPVVLVACGFRGSETATPPHDAAAEADAPGTSNSDAAVSSPDAAEIDAPMTASTPTDCKDALAQGITTSGLVTIDPDGTGGNPPFQIYCDQTTAGGGWGLVWVYQFTDYANFMSSQNAVTPRPTWGGTGTATSTTIPTSPTTLGALDFAKWASLGDEVMASSDVNNWVKCQPGTGSVVGKVEGTVTCQAVKAVVNFCNNVVPGYWFTSLPNGFGFNASSSAFSTYYFYEGSTTANWPTHDPCGSNNAYQKQNVPNPHGQLWVRRR